MMLHQSNTAHTIQLIIKQAAGQKIQPRRPAGWHSIDLPPYTARIPDKLFKKDKIMPIISKCKATLRLSH